MSIILKGIDMPKEYRAVEIKFYVPNIIHSDNIYINGREMLDQEISALFTAEHLNDIIQIPKGHGRLIDADTKIKAELYDSENGAYIEKEMTIEQWFMFMQNDAPTILEAEEE